MKRTHTLLGRILQRIRPRSKAPSGRGSATPEYRIPIAPPPAPKEPHVYLSKRGTRFHWDPDCPHILEAFNRGDVVKMDLSKAKAAGLKGCSKCCHDYLR